MNNEFTMKEAREWNESQLELRENLPSFYHALELAQEGDMDTIGLFFFFKRIVTPYYYDGKRQLGVESKLEFMDNSIHYFLKGIKSKYSDNRGITSVDGIGGSNYKITTSSLKFEEDEIDMMFYEYIMEFIHTQDLSRFEGTSEEHRDNKLYKYIRIDFENSVLKTEYNKRMGVDRVQVDGEQYLVKNKLEEVFFDDITVSNHDDEEDGELDFLGVIDELTASGQGREYGRDAESQFIMDNYKDVVTNHQRESIEKILEWCEQDGNDINDLFSKNNPYEFSKTEIAKILHPDKKSSSVMKSIDNLFMSMNNRMDKATEKAGVKREKTPIRSDFANANLDNRDNRLIKEFKIEEYVIGYKKSTLPSHPMYDSFRKKNTDREFIEMEHYQQVLNGEMTVQALIDMYEIDKNKMNALNGGVITYVLSDDVNASNEEYSRDEQTKQEKKLKMVSVEHVEEKNANRMITPIELGRIRRESKNKKNNQ